jgi:hypothetical protein
VRHSAALTCDCNDLIFALIVAAGMAEVPRLPLVNEHLNDVFTGTTVDLPCSTDDA